MAGLEDLIGTFAGASQPFTSDTPSAGLATAASSTPTDYRALLGPILESVAAEARRKADPINRLYDIGGAIHDDVATGGSFQKSMLAADQALQSSIAGAGNMFLNMLSKERQLEQLKQTGTFQNAQIANMAETRRLQEKSIDKPSIHTGTDELGRTYTYLFDPSNRKVTILNPDQGT